MFCNFTSNRFSISIQLSITNVTDHASQKAKVTEYTVQITEETRTRFNYRKPKISEFPLLESKNFSESSWNGSELA